MFVTNESTTAAVLALGRARPTAVPTPKVVPLPTLGTRMFRPTLPGRGLRRPTPPYRPSEFVCAGPWGWWGPRST
jgi:hypothetical protein